MQLDSDPFDDGDVSGGIKAHEAAGHSFEDIVGYVVGERNQLRLQNGQLWKIIEKQRVIMEGLKTEITELKLREETRVLASLSVPDVIGAIESSHQDIPSISELRRSITEHSALELASFRSSGKRVSTYEATVDENEVKAYTGLVDSFLPESEDADPPLRGASLKHKNSFILPSRTSSMMLAYTPSNEDLRHPHPHPQQASILSAFRESTSSNPPSRKSSRPPTPLPPAPQTLNEVPLVSSSNSAPGSSANSRSTTPIPAPLSVTTQPLPQNPLVHSLSLSSEDGIIVRVVGSAFQGTGADGVLFFVLVKKERTNEEWKVEKRYSDFIALDGKLRSKLSKQVMSSIGKPPEKSLFTSMNPVKSDQRKVALEMYLQRVLDAVPDSREMFHFLTTSVSSGQPLALFQSSGSIPGLQTAESTADIDGIMSPLNTDTTILKEGYLMKRGKNFGGWKPRYFRCKPYFLDYSDGPHREFSSTISLKHCHIASIKPAANDTKSAHGLILIEFQKEHFPVPFDIQPPPESKIKHRHILAADSDVDRDDWVSIIFTQIKEARGLQRVSERHITNPTMPQPQKQPSVPYSIASSDETGSLTTTSPRMSRQEDPYVLLQKQNSRHTIMTMMPPPASNNGVMGGLNAQHFATTSQIVIKNSLDDNLRAMQQVPKSLPVISGSAREKERQEEKEKVGSPVGSMDRPHTGPAAMASVKGLMHQHIMRNPFGKKKTDPPVLKALDPNRLIFGAPLEHGLAISRISDDIELPAIVYRCIEYLDHFKASQEEGIYRLSGTSTAIQHLKYLFNLEGDVDLINCNLDMMDVHVVSGLLKLYLRELPTPVLTKNLQNEFMAISNFDDRNDRILQLAHLLSLLPRTNYILLETLISHLVSIVQASNVNKMSVRNVGIVFAPTLGVPALVFILLLAEFNDLFCWDDEGKTALMKERIREMHVRKEREAVVAASVAAAANPLPENVGDSIADRSSDGESPKRDLSPTGEGPSISPVAAIQVLGTEGLMSDSEIRKIME